MGKRSFLSRLFGPQEFEASRPWEPSVAQPIAQPQVIGRPVAPRDPVMTRYIQLPLTAAIICGLFAALLPTAIVAGIVAWTKAGGWWLASVPATFMVSALLLSGAAWYVLFVRGIRILEFLERLTGMDLNNDHSIGGAKPQKEPFRFEHSDPQRRAIKYDELPATEEEMVEVARAILKMKCPLSRRELARATSLSEGAADKLLSGMRDTGLARFRSGGPNAGTELTGKGHALLGGLLSS